MECLASSLNSSLKRLVSLRFHPHSSSGSVNTVRQKGQLTSGLDNRTLFLNCGILEVHV